MMDSKKLALCTFRLVRKRELRALTAVVKAARAVVCAHDVNRMAVESGDNAESAMEAAHAAREGAKALRGIVSSENVLARAVRAYDDSLSPSKK